MAKRNRKKIKKAKTIKRPPRVFFDGVANRHYILDKGRKRFIKTKFDKKQIQEHIIKNNVGFRSARQRRTGTPFMRTEEVLRRTGRTNEIDLKQAEIDKLKQQLATRTLVGEQDLANYNRFASREGTSTVAIANKIDTVKKESDEKIAATKKESDEKIADAKQKAELEIAKVKRDITSLKQNIKNAKLNAQKIKNVKALTIPQIQKDETFEGVKRMIQTIGPIISDDEKDDFKRFFQEINDGINTESNKKKIESLTSNILTDLNSRATTLIDALNVAESKLLESSKKITASKEERDTAKQEAEISKKQVAGVQVQLQELGEQLSSKELANKMIDLENKKLLEKNNFNERLKTLTIERQKTGEKNYILNAKNKLGENIIITITPNMLIGTKFESASVQQLRAHKENFLKVFDWSQRFRVNKAIDIVFKGVLPYMSKAEINELKSKDEIDNAFKLTLKQEDKLDEIILLNGERYDESDKRIKRLKNELKLAKSNVQKGIINKSITDEKEKKNVFNDNVGKYTIEVNIIRSRIDMINKKASELEFAPLDNTSRRYVNALESMDEKISDDANKLDELDLPMLPESSETTAQEPPEVQEPQTGEGKADDDGIYDSDINHIMKKMKIPSFVGCISSDEVHLLPKRDKISFIMNTDPSYKPGKHWVACNVDKNEGSIEYYDSFGTGSTNGFKKEMKKYVSDVPYLCKFKENNVVEQSNNSTLCGYHSMNFIIDRNLKNKSFKKVTNYKDGKMKKFKKKLEKFGYV